MSLPFLNLFFKTNLSNMNIINLISYQMCVCVCVCVCKYNITNTKYKISSIHKNRSKSKLTKI